MSYLEGRHFGYTENISGRHGHGQVAIPVSESPPSESPPSENPPSENPPSDSLVIPFVQKVQFVIVGVYVFCSTPIWALPSALKEGGWLSLVVLVFFFAMTLYTAIICIPSCIDDEYNQKTYPAVGERACDAPLRWTIWVFILIFSIGTCVDCVMMLKDLMEVFFKPHATYATIIIILIMVIILCTEDLDEYDPWLPGIGLILVCVVIACSIYVGWTKTDFSIKDTVLFNFPYQYSSVGFYAMCFCGHSYTPPIYVALHDRRSYTCLLLVIYSISGLLYFGTGMMGYSMFGNHVSTNFTLALPRDWITSKLVMCCMVLSHIIRYGLNLSPVAVAVDELMPTPLKSLRGKNAIRFALGVLTAVVLFSNTFYSSLSVAGTVVGVIMSLIFPAGCYKAIITRDNLSWPQKAAANVAIFLGVTGAVCALIWNVEPVLIAKGLVEKMFTN